MNIRPYHAEDKHRLVRLFTLNTPRYFDTLEVREYKDYLDNYSSDYYTIEDDGKIVGGVGFYVKPEDNTGRITWIFFHPDHARHGLGTQAVNFCIKELRQDPVVEKLVVQTSQQAFHFFEKFGFVTVSTQKDFWGEGLDLYLMEKPVR